MPTTVVGFRLGDDTRSRQTTLLVTENGLLHHAHGVYGHRGTCSRPRVPTGEHPVRTHIAALRRSHDKALRAGHTRVLIPPASIRLDLEEPPLARRPYGPDAPQPYPELIDAFTDAAPAAPRELQSAIRDFYDAIGLPTRPPRPAPPSKSASVPPLVAHALRALTRGEQLDARLRGPLGYTITPDAVRLHAGRAGEDLDYPQVVQLQAALTAWLHFNQPRRS
ncbi:hypothetical protein [Streptomyces sp. ODS28]|uniref:hypothetical protein n=1 Tax=Streptomyces sp. ODS28 TaxID=3136688 RepID=UPI0031E5F816